MKKKLIYTLVAVIMGASFTLTSCGNGAKKEFNKLLLEVADNDATVDGNDWAKIKDFLDKNKARFKDFFKGGKLDEEKVEEYIEDFFENRRPPKNISFTNVAIMVNFYLERSGSMVPYDAPQGDGSFKAAIVDMLNALPGNDNKMFVVNSSVTPYPKGLQQFVRDADIFGSTKGLGDASYTDFGQIFDNILNKTGKDEMSILVTDMIYSTRDMAGVNPQKVFAEAQGMTASVFKSSVKEKSMLIIKMEGSYNGPYYAYNSPQSGKIYNGKRPYYIIIVGDNKVMRRLAKNSNYQTFCNFARLRGYQNMYLFDTDDLYEPYYSLLLAGDDMRGSFRPVRGQDTQVTKIEDVRVDKNSGDLQLELAVDLSGMFIDKDYLNDVNNYEVQSDGKVTIKEIRPLKSSDMTPNEKKYLGSATHIFVLSVDKPSAQDIHIKLLNRLPSWVEMSNDDDDTTVEPQTTFGLKYLLQGIYDSYARNTDGTPCYFELDLEVKR
ncbi:MAG: hypothetical protein ACOYJG_08505 [Prevotella sp.]|jgi:hypothetical protein